MGACATEGGICQQIGPMALVLLPVDGFLPSRCRQERASRGCIAGHGNLAVSGHGGCDMTRLRTIFKWLRDLLCLGKGFPCGIDSHKWESKIEAYRCLSSGCY